MKPQLSPAFRDTLTDLTRAWDLLCTGALMGLLMHHTSTAHWAADMILMTLAMVAMLVMGKLWGMHSFTRQKGVLSQVLAAAFSYVSLFGAMLGLVWLRGISLELSYVSLLVAGGAVALMGHGALLGWANTRLRQGKGLRKVAVVTHVTSGKAALPAKDIATITQMLTQAGFAQIETLDSLAPLETPGQNAPDDVILLPALPTDKIARRALVNQVALIPSHIWQYRHHIDHGLTPNYLGNLPLFCLFPRPFEGRVRWLKRSLDLAVAIPAFVAILPVFLLLAPINPLLYRTHPLYWQTRHGLLGKKFQIFKFQSYRVSEADDKVVQTTKGDSRITPFGHFIRRTSLDELPQIWGILKGDMSLVGPRPHAMVHDAEYGAKITGYTGRFRMPPGITGWAQVNGWRGETETLDKMENRIWHDLAYMHNWSIWLDIKILLRTFLVMIHKNAY